MFRLEETLVEGVKNIDAAYATLFDCNVADKVRPCHSLLSACCVLLAPCA